MYPIILKQLILLDNSPANVDLFVNAYFDTGDGYLANNQKCNSINQNCNDIVKFYDGTTFNFFSPMDVSFMSTSKKCIKMQSDYVMTTADCDNGRQICLFDCCKSFGTKFHQCYEILY